MDAEKETDSSKSAPSHCKTEREEPSIKNAAEAEGGKNESDAEADGVSQAADEAECVLEAKAIEAPEVSGEGGIQGHDPEQTEEGSGARSPHADGPDNLPVLSEAKAQSNAYRCKKCGATATCEVQCYAIPNFKQIVKDKCNGDSTYCTVAPDGLSLQIDTNPTDSKSDITQSWGDVVASPYVQAANKALGLPDSLWNSMKNTTGSQGKQTKTYGIIEVSWSYLPRHGLEVLYENTSGKTPVSGTTA